MKKIYLFLFLLVPIVFTQCDIVTNHTVESKDETPKVKNVIILIGDGMGTAQVYAGLTGNKGSLHVERCHFVGFSKTYSANAYITDSAAGGTAIACGTKTNNGAIGVDADGNLVKSVLEYAAENGLATGVVVSCDVTHATPASFVAHQANRGMAEEIAEDYVKSDLDVFIGGGRKNFEERSDKQNLTDKLKEKDFTIAYNLEDAKKVTSGKLVALVADEHPEKYPERGELLPEGVQTAINILKQNDKGFCLMVEGSQIDWACHSNITEEAVSEMIDLDRTIKIAFDYADKDPNTLVIITADHETGGMTLTGGDFTTGEVKAEWGTKGHSSVMVPVFAYGAGAKEFAGIYQNTDILPKVLKLYGFAK
ncbi:MAG: alkaline phosphatase [Tannerellaceae bacterium]|jgi:alkaline phosphatase|nr:alkaline phosphatase [Tannerellaceae bacterium]